MIALQIIGGLIGVILLYLIIIIFLPVLKVPEQPMKNRKINTIVPDCREDVSFIVEGSRISAWFYKTDNSTPSPCIIMSHGFGGTKDMALEQYALKFTKRGYSVLVYDYRYYGKSEGQPRQLYCGIYQVEDLKGAVKYVRAREDVDENKVVLWGTSAGANYGIIVAAEDFRIAAVIAQCGAFDHKEDNKLYYGEVGKMFFIKLLVHAQRDKGRSRFGLSPHKYPAYGKPGTIAMLNTAGSFEGIEKLAVGSELFKNETCARLAFMPHPADPLKAAPIVKCPVQVLVCKKDNLVSPKSHIRLVEILGEKADVIEYPIGHFDIYFGESFEKATNEQLAFLDQKVGNN